MRILMTTDTVGGVWTFTKQLSGELLEQGHHVALVSFGRMPSPSQQAWCDATACSFRYSFVCGPSDAPLEWMEDNEQAYTRGAPALRAAADTFHPDILLTSQYTFAAVPLSIPKIVIAHSDVLSWAASCSKAPLPPTRWLTQYRRLVSEGLRAATAVVAPTSWMLSALGRNFTLPPLISVIPNGRTVEPSSARHTRRNQAITAGRFWDEGKNLAFLDHVTPPLPILVAGSVQPSTREAGAPLKFLGELPEAVLLNLFRESSIYLCTSIYEPFGLAPLEAALCGCAVVANDIPSLREVWGEGALFFHDTASLTRILHELRDPARLHHAQQRSLDRANLYTASRMAEHYLSLFDQVLGTNARTARSSAHAA